MATGVLRPFTPAGEDARDLRRRTVGRDDLLDHLASTLRTAATGRRRDHSLLVGPRGSGKSHLLAVAVGALLDDPDLAGRYAVVRVPEDGLGVTRLADVLDAVLTTLGAATTDDRAAAVRDAVGDRVLLLTVENLDRVLGNLGPAGRRDLRAWLRSSGALVLATTPTVPDALREEDWSGTFTDLALTALATDDAAELVTLLARDRGDHATAELLAGATGRARLAALGHLTGGSPRSWTILAGLLDERSLDELTPAVVRLVEQLVPHHQQLLWELPPNEQRVVRALADGGSTTLTVGDLSDRADLGQAVTSTTLKRLAAGGWVTSAKLRTGDRRRTWYRLRDPLLRHHVQDRSRQTQPLAQAAALLRVLLDPAERERHRPAEPPGTDLLRELAATLDRVSERLAPNPALRRDVDGLQLLAHQWQAREDLTYLGTDLVELVDRARDRSTGDLAEAVGALLRTADGSGLTAPEAVLLDLTAVTWDAHRDPAATRAALAGLAPAAGETGLLRPLDTTIAALAAEHTGQGAFDHARELHALLVDLRGEHAGRLHPASLAARGDLAWATAMAGDLAGSLALHEEVVADAVDALGAIDPTTLRLRQAQAVVRGWAGSPEQAAEDTAALVADLEEVGAPGRADLLRARSWLALDLGRRGQYDEQVRELERLLPEAVTTYGASAHTVLFLRSDLAAARARAGDHEGAAADLDAVVADATGADEPTGTLALHHRARRAAVAVGAADRAGALRFLVALADDAPPPRPLHDWCVLSVLAVTDGPADAAVTEALRTETGLLARVAAARAGDEEALVALPPELAAALDHPPGG
ncbi:MULTISPECIES: MarR family transcriptional regulator [unclassified Nocardioides]|uniref:MarR family transcriptional regulator n=1 Tax=unclassified Nocardioides TaxID=2615069 RepID=UPI0030157EAD